MWPIIVTLVSAAIIVFIAVCIGATVLAIAIWIQTRRERRDRPSEDDEGDDGGSVWRRPRRPSGGGDGDLAWWPQFEREFAEYAAREAESRRRT